MRTNFERQKKIIEDKIEKHLLFDKFLLDKKKW